MQWTWFKSPYTLTIFMSTSHSDHYNEARTKWPTSWDISLKLSCISKSVNGCHQGCLNNPIFANFGLCAACWTHFMCHHELWPSSGSHPFCFLNSSLGLDGEKHYQKITITVFRLVLQSLLFQVTFLIFFSTAIFFSLLSSGKQFFFFIVSHLNALQYNTLFPLTLFSCLK